jgi:hypothetical protein
MPNVATAIAMASSKLLPAGVVRSPERDRYALDAKAKAFDADLQHDLEQAGGPKYAAIAMLAYRQTLAATAGGVIDTIRRPSRFMQRPATAGRFSFR